MGKYITENSNIITIFSKIIYPCANNNKNIKFNTGVNILLKIVIL